MKGRLRTRLLSAIEAELAKLYAEDDPNRYLVARLESDRDYLRERRGQLGPDLRAMAEIRYGIMS